MTKIKQYNIESFSQKTIKAIKYYVYALVNPKTENIFYIGKGSKNRCFKSWKEQLHPEHHMFCFHQSMFSKKDIFDKYRFNTLYKVCADYEWTLKSYFNKMNFKFIDLPIVNYKEGGFSEKNKIKARIPGLFFRSSAFPFTRYTKKIMEINDSVQNYIFVHSKRSRQGT